MVKQRNSKTGHLNPCQYKAGVFHVQSTLVKHPERQNTQATKLVFGLFAYWQDTHFGRLVARMVGGVISMQEYLTHITNNISAKVKTSHDLEFLKRFLRNEKISPYIKA